MPLVHQTFSSNLPRVLLGHGENSMHKPPDIYSSGSAETRDTLSAHWEDSKV